MTVLLVRDWRGYKAGEFVFDLLPEQVAFLKAKGYVDHGEGGTAKAIESPERDKMLRQPARKK